MTNTNRHSPYPGLSLGTARWEGLPYMTKQTDLQVLVKAMTAIQYEIKALGLIAQADENVLSEVHSLQVEAKHLMQSAAADADLFAAVEEHGKKESHAECCG